MASINSPNSSIKVRGGRTRQDVTTRRSLSGDGRKYIEHLEGELSAVQSELPTVTHEHIVKMKRISAENRQLQAQLKDWEMRFDDQVRDCVQQHTMVESALRNKNSNLEDYASKAKNRVEELEAQLQNMRQALEGAEAANVQLEKRIEIMSELLTASPAKVDFQADAPTRRRMQPRPRSMLPRVPNHRGSWIGSPERTPDFGALSSPVMSFAIRDNTPEAFEPLERIVSREVWMSSPNQPPSEEDDRPSPRSATFSDHLRDQEAQHIRARPRRMRRFGGGSSGPKPLILPYASQMDTNAMTAPPLDRHETAPSLPFRRSVQLDILESPTLTRPRAATSASENALHLLDSSDFKEAFDEAGFNRMLNLARKASDTRTLSLVSTGSDAGLTSRNLFEELHAAKVADPSKHDTDAGADNSFLLEAESSFADSPYVLQTQDALLLSSHAAQETPSSIRQWPAESMEMSALQRENAFNPALEGIYGPFLGLSPDPDATPKASTVGKRSIEIAVDEKETDEASLSALDRLHNTFGDLLRSPGDIARMIVHVTQQRMHLPAPLLSVQWWIVGLLWGPLAKRQQMIQHSTSDDGRYRPDFVTRAPSLAINESLAYGTLYTSPTSGLRQRIGMAGPGKKRQTNTKHCIREDKSVLARHNPLLWLKFSITLAYAVGVAFTSGPGTLLRSKQCTCPACKSADQ